MSVRRGTSITITFAAIDSLNRPARATGVAFSGDVTISKDGNTFTNITNAVTEIGTSGRYKVTLTSAEMDAAWVHIRVEKSGIDPVDICIGTDGSASGVVVTDGGNTSSTFKTDRTEATTDFWKDSLLLFVSGALAGQVKKVSAYNGTTKFVTLSAGFTGAPSDGDRFIFVNM